MRAPIPELRTQTQVDTFQSEPYQLSVSLQPVFLYTHIST